MAQRNRPVRDRGWVSAMALTIRPKVGYVLAGSTPGEPAFPEECALSEILDDLVADLSESGRF